MVEILNLKDPRKRAAALLSTMTEEEISSPQFYQELIKIGKEISRYDDQLLLSARLRKKDEWRRRQTPEQIKQDIVWSNWRNSQTETHRTCFCCGKPRNKGQWFCSHNCYWIEIRRDKIRLVKS